MDKDRRVFMLRVAAAGSALAATQGHAQAKVDPKDPQAVALGFVEDTTKADAKKFPNHANSQMCDGCQLFQGKAGAASGPCAIFTGKIVPGHGWCSAWTKKP